MSDDITTTVQRTLKTAFYNDIQVKVEFIEDGDGCGIIKGYIVQRSKGTEEIQDVSIFGDSIEALVGLHLALDAFLLHPEECVETPWLGD